jgi:EAL domain-containing protein (putative c-di-GMP-specific phosphodiesterase class I)
LRNRGFISQIEQTVSIDPHAAAGLEMEITESLIKAQHRRPAEHPAMDVRIAVDDFGTGFSSLSYLAKLPVHTLKIDRSFIVDMTGGADGLALVSTIISLAHSLKPKIVAEGVETEEQLSILRGMKYDEMQGYRQQTGAARRL